MKISPEKPPNYEEICKVFDVKDKPVVFTYGETIYNVPEKHIMPEHLQKHEFVHTKQQGEHPEIWWEKYLKDKDFRLEQELQAYAVQYKFCKDNALRKVSDRFLDMISRDLSSEVYGNIVSFIEAQTKIRRLAKEIL